MSNQRAGFIERAQCINCGSEHLSELSSGRFSDEPLLGYIKNDPWGESPIPYVQHETWEFVECNSCQQKYHKRILSPEWIEKCYSEWVTQEAMEAFLTNINTPANNFKKAQQNVLHILRLEKLTRRLRKDDVLRVLDFGCGWGDFLALCDNFGFRSCGIDFSPDRRQQGRVHIFPNKEDLKSSQDGEQPFHVITMFEVLEHLANPSEVLQSLSELLMPGGILILETPDCTGVTDIVSDWDYRKIHPLSHINGFTPNTLRSIAERVGFKSIEPSVAHVTSEPLKVIKTEIKRIIRPLLKGTTQQYFLKI